MGKIPKKFLRGVINLKVEKDYHRLNGQQGQFMDITVTVWALMAKIGKQWRGFTLTLRCWAFEA